MPYPSILDDNLTQLIAYADPYIFTSIERKPLRHGNWRRRYFQPAVTAAQAEDTTFPTLTPHDLRHTAASLAIASGANVKAVQRMLGHSTATLTLDRYADLFPDDLDNVATSMDKLIRSGLKADQMTTGQTPNPEG